MANALPLTGAVALAVTDGTMPVCVWRGDPTPDTALAGSAERRLLSLAGVADAVALTGAVALADIVALLGAADRVLLPTDDGGALVWTGAALATAVPLLVDTGPGAVGIGKMRLVRVLLTGAAEVVIVPLSEGTGVMVRLADKGGTNPLWLGSAVAVMVPLPRAVDVAMDPLLVDTGPRPLDGSTVGGSVPFAEGADAGADKLTAADDTTALVLLVAAAGATVVLPKGAAVVLGFAGTGGTPGDKTPLDRGIALLRLPNEDTGSGKAVTEREADDDGTAGGEGTRLVIATELFANGTVADKGSGVR